MTRIPYLIVVGVDIDEEELRQFFDESEIATDGNVSITDLIELNLNEIPSVHVQDIKILKGVWL